VSRARAAGTLLLVAVAIVVPVVEVIDKLKQKVKH
jgi:hypothetical protein